MLAGTEKFLVVACSARTQWLKATWLAFPVSCSLAFPLLSHFSTRSNQSRKIAETTKRANFRVGTNTHPPSNGEVVKEKSLMCQRPDISSRRSMHKPTLYITTPCWTLLQFFLDYSFQLPYMSPCACMYLDDETYIYMYVRVSWKGSSVQASKTLDTCTTIQSDDVPDTRSELINFRRTFPINFHGKQLINEGCIIEGFEDTTLKFSKNDDPSNIW